MMEKHAFDDEEYEKKCTIFKPRGIRGTPLDGKFISLRGGEGAGKNQLMRFRKTPSKISQTLLRLRYAAKTAWSGVLVLGVRERTDMHFQWGTPPLVMALTRMPRYGFRSRQIIDDIIHARRGVMGYIIDIPGGKKEIFETPNRGVTFSFANPCHEMGHGYAEKICPKCGRDFCFSCCEETNVHECGKYYPNFMICPTCGHDYYAE